MPFEEVESVFPDLWDFDTDPVLEGIYRGFEEKNTKYGTSKMYYLTPTGESDQVAFWGSAVLDNKLAQITPPAMVRVTFDGKETEGAKTTKMFTVARDSSWTGDEDIPF